MAKKMTTADFVTRATQLYGSRFDYSQVDYVGMFTAVRIVCRQHGVFEQTPHTHLRVSGQAKAESKCPACFIAWNTARQVTDQDVYLAKVREVHKDKDYDYSKVVYTGCARKIEVICREHGSFVSNAGNFLHSTSTCPKCARRSAANKCRGSLDNFMDRFVSAHGGSYDYSQAVYVSSHVPVTIICKTHGAFSQAPADHAEGHGCPACGWIRAPGQPRRPWESVTAEAHSVHAGRYTYSTRGYAGASGSLWIGCSLHGWFKQGVGNHLRGTGCPKCATSKQQENLYTLMMSYVPSGCSIRMNDRKLLDGKELDIVIPELSLGVELNGTYWHSGMPLNVERRGTHWIKWHQAEKQAACIRKSLRLFQFYDDEVKDRWDAVRNMILLAMQHKDTTIPARKTTAVHLDWKTASDFLDKYHLQGAGVAGTAYGLVYEDALVACAVFAARLSHRGSGAEGVVELSRVGFSCHVVGGASKLLKAYLRNFPCRKIVSYSDRRFSQGGLYRALGFEHEGTSDPDYCYTVNGVRVHKSAFRRANLRVKLGDRFDETLSEYENCYNAKIYRLYNCGLDKWGLTL